jgi:hypothetical protein
MSANGGLGSQATGVSDMQDASALSVSGTQQTTTDLVKRSGRLPGWQVLPRCCTVHSHPPESPQGPHVGNVLIALGCLRAPSTCPSAFGTERSYLQRLSHCHI